MTQKEAYNALWKLICTARVNQRYYAVMSGFACTVHNALRLTTVALAVVGGVSGIVAAIPNTNSGFSSTSVAVGVIAMAVTILVDMIGAQRLQLYVTSLRDKWTNLRSGCEQMFVEIDRNSDDTLTAKPTSRLQEMIALKNEIDKGETFITIRPLHNWAQKKINRQVYEVKDGTFEEVMQKLGLNGPNAAPQ